MLSSFEEVVSPVLVCAWNPWSVASPPWLPVLLQLRLCVVYDVYGTLAFQRLCSEDGGRPRCHSNASEHSQSIYNTMTTLADS